MGRMGGDVRKLFSFIGTIARSETRRSFSLRGAAYSQPLHENQPGGRAGEHCNLQKANAAQKRNLGPFFRKKGTRYALGGPAEISEGEEEHADHQVTHEEPRGNVNARGKAQPKTPKQKSKDAWIWRKTGRNKASECAGTAGGPIVYAFPPLSQEKPITSTL